MFTSPCLWIPLPQHPPKSFSSLNFPPWGAQLYHPSSLLFLNPAGRLTPESTPAVPSTWKVFLQGLSRLHPHFLPVFAQSHYLKKGLPWPPYLTLHTTPRSLRGTTCQSPTCSMWLCSTDVIIFRLTERHDLSSCLVIDKIKHMLHHHLKHWSSSCPFLILSWMKYLEKFLPYNRPENTYLNKWLPRNFYCFYKWGLCEKIIVYCCCIGMQLVFLHWSCSLVTKSHCSF